jgi:hypothetical protein
MCGDRVEGALVSVAAALRLPLRVVAGEPSVFVRRHGYNILAEDAKINNGGVR